MKQTRRDKSKAANHEIMVGRFFCSTKDEALQISPDAA